MIGLAVVNIEKHRAEIMKEVAGLISDSSQAAMQKSISMWGGRKLVFPDFNNIFINGGCMNFQFLLNSAQANSEVTVSLWYTFGESRIGFIIPYSALPAGFEDRTDEANRIACFFDGSRELCNIIDHNDCLLFDWIFKDGFSSFENGVLAMSASNPNSKIVSAMIASKLADILVHLYINITTTLASQNQASISFCQSTLIGGEKFSVIFVGNIEAFEYYLIEYGATSSRPIKNLDGPGMTCVISSSSSTPLSLGSHGNENGSFDVLSCEKIK